MDRDKSGRLTNLYNLKWVSMLTSVTKHFLLKPHSLPYKTLFLYR